METIIEKATINDVDSLIDVQNQSFFQTIKSMGYAHLIIKRKKK